jgi:hypothetical protein
MIFRTLQLVICIRSKYLLIITEEDTPNFLIIWLLEDLWYLLVYIELQTSI